MTSNKELIRYLIQRGVLKTTRIIKAFENIDRADFVSKDKLNEAYEDYPLSIGSEQTISQPSTVAFMLELLQPKEGDKILDVGSGSGYTTALLSQIVGSSGEVFGVELVPELVVFGVQNLKKYNITNAKILQANGKVLGLPKKAPFNKILVSASANEFPQELVDQLDLSGILIIPIKNSVYSILKKEDGSLESKEFPEFSFVPLK